DPSSFVIAPDNCTGKTLDTKGKPLSKCTVGVAFAPAAVSGPVAVTETLSIKYDATNPAMATLTGTGIAATMKTPTSVTLPKTKAGLVSAQKSITLSNTSVGANVTLGAPSAIGPNFTITSDTCSGVALTPKGLVGSKCVVKVTFNPPKGTPRGRVVPVSLSYNFSFGANPPGTVTTTLKGTVK